MTVFWILLEAMQMAGQRWRMGFGVITEKTLRAGWVV